MIIIITIVVVGVAAQVIQLSSSSVSHQQSNYISNLHPKAPILSLLSPFVSYDQSHHINNLHSTAPTSSKADVKEPEDEQQVDDMKQERSDCKYSYKW